VQLISVGVLGEYVGRIFNEVKRRPLYLLNQLLDSELGGDYSKANEKETQL
jgi:hypothetical protein